MSIQNINFLQSDNDTAYIPGITTYTASSIYQSLANSGQRYGAKGDSVAIGYFTIKDITGVAEGDSKDPIKPEPPIPSEPAEPAVPISMAETDAKSNTNKKSDVGKVIVSTDVVSIGGITVDAADNLLNDIAKADINAANNALVYYDKKNERLILRYKGISYTASNIKSDNTYKPDDFNDTNIFNLIIAALNNDLILSDDSKVIIPEDYKFYYYYNSNNDHEVWSSSEYIVVNYVTDITQVVPNTVCVIDKAAKQNYSNIYKFSISYNKDKNQILVTKVYALPYINNNHYWVVNGTETGIYASGDYTGQPNIMMIHTSYDAGTHKVLHMPSLTAYDYNDTINRVEWTQSYCNLNLITSITTSGNGTGGSVKTTTYKAYTYVPVISQLNTNDDLLSLYKNSLLINIIDSTYNEKLYTTSTLWQFDNIEKKFTYIANDTNGCVFSMADLSSTYSAFDIFVKNYSATFVPDEYQYRSLAFKQVKDELKNTDKNSQALANKGFLLSHVMSSANANQVSNNAVLKLYYNNYKLDSNNGYIPDLSNTSYYSIDFNRKIDVKCLEEASITDGQTSKKSSTYYDYTFKDNVPILDIAETILDGVTIKDTQSILALNDSGTAYTASLGFDYYSFDKNTIYLSSSAYIPKIGNIDLAKSYYGEYLKGPSNFKIDLKNTIMNTVVWNQLSENIYSTTYTPIYKDNGYPVEIYFNGYDGSDPNKAIYNQNIYTSVLATYCTEYKDEPNGQYKPPKDIIAFKVYDANGNQNGTNESKEIVLGETRLLNVNKFLKRFGIDIGTSPVKPTDEKYINYWLELGQYGLGTDNTQMIDDGQWLGNPIKLTYSVDTDTEDRNLIKKVIIEEQNVNNYWSSNSTVYLTPTYDNEHNQSGNTKNVMIRVGKRVVIEFITKTQDSNGNIKKDIRFNIPSDLVPVNKLTNTSDSSKQVVTLDEYINSGKI